MKFLVDAQLPRKLSQFLIDKGFESIHTLDLPKRNFTTDIEIIELSLKHELIVITKDSDFYNSFLQHAEPYKLIFLTVGNTSTIDLITMFDKNLNLIIDTLHQYFVIEISTKNIIAII